LIPFSFLVRRTFTRWSDETHLHVAVVIGVGRVAGRPDGRGGKAGRGLFQFDEQGGSVRKTSQEPSTLQKINQETKEFFGQVGQTLSPKKPAPKKKAPHPYNPWVKQTKKEKSSWLSSWFAPKEPDPPRSLNEWMDLKPIRP
jgi:hypothetical protein